MKRDVYIVENVCTYGPIEQYIYAYAYGSYQKAYNSMVEEFAQRFSDVFDSNESIEVKDLGEWEAELRNGDEVITWGIECQSVEFDQ